MGDNRKGTREQAGQPTHHLMEKEPNYRQLTGTLIQGTGTDSAGNNPDGQHIIFVGSVSMFSCHLPLP